jgi:hypothetical protein
MNTAVAESATSANMVAQGRLAIATVNGINQKTSMASTTKAV